MIYASSSDYFQRAEQVPISFSEWKAILSRLTTKEATRQLFRLFQIIYIVIYFNRLSSSTDAHRRSKSRQYSSPTKKKERQLLPRNQVFGGTVVDSFLLSSTSNIAQSSIGISRQGIQKRRIKRLHFLFFSFQYNYNTTDLFIQMHRK
jgi:hypothetical protein